MFIYQCYTRTYFTSNASNFTKKTRKQGVAGSKKQVLIYFFW